MALDRRPLDALQRLLASDLNEATMSELVDYFSQIDAAEIEARGSAIQAMRDKGASWRVIETSTGRAQSTIRYWHQRYLDQLNSQK